MMCICLSSTKLLVRAIMYWDTKHLDKSVKGHNKVYGLQLCILQIDCSINVTGYTWR